MLMNDDDDDDADDDDDDDDDDDNDDADVIYCSVEWLQHCYTKHSISSRVQTPVHRAHVIAGVN